MDARQCIHTHTHTPLVTCVAWERKPEGLVTVANSVRGCWFLLYKKPSAFSQTVCGLGVPRHWHPPQFQVLPCSHCFEKLHG